MSKKAFTLIELAVVLLVIGILAGVVLRNIGGFTASARDSRRIGDLRNVSTYLGQYLLKTGKYPTSTTWDDLEATLHDAGVLSAGSPLPRDPLAGRKYYYAYCTTSGETAPTHYVIWAYLETTVDKSPQIFKDSAFGTISAKQNDFGWQCTLPQNLPQNVNSVTCGSSSTFCLVQ